jgi:hypothetical protein
MNLGRRHFNLVDCISYVTMSHYKARKAFCFKTSYEEQGYVLIPEINDNGQALNPFGRIVKYDPKTTISRNRAVTGYTKHISTEPLG